MSGRRCGCPKRGGGFGPAQWTNLHRERRAADGGSCRNSNGRISAVGSDADARTWISSTTRVIDLHGHAAYPGFKDSHAHLLSLGLSRLNVELEDARDFDEVIARVKRAARGQPPGTWILGRG